MDFTYTYRTSDGKRHKGAISAPSRDEAFSELRRRGIRPMRMVADGLETADGRRGYGEGWIVGGILAGASIACALMWYFTGGNESDVSSQSISGNPPVQQSHEQEIARPRPRKQIEFSDGESILSCARSLPTATEQIFAVYAQPAIDLGMAPFADETIREDFYDSIEEPLYISPDDSRAMKDLKRIIAGMKESAVQAVASGMTPEEFVRWLSERQKMECSYLRHIIVQLQIAEEGGAEDMEERRKEANDQLKAMGFPRIEVPPSVH